MASCGQLHDPLGRCGCAQERYQLILLTRWLLRCCRDPCSQMKALVAKIVEAMPVEEFPQAPAHALFKKYGATAPKACKPLPVATTAFAAGVIGGAIAGVLVALLLKRK